ncbi:MAG: hypothetical protein HGA96_14410 [Desulfobulbaceae bacterium]|nr:hypothetical protein [Desulfobulbaceae bacterium]
MSKSTLKEIQIRILVIIVLLLSLSNYSISHAEVQNISQEVDDIAKFPQIKGSNTGAAIYELPIKLPSGVGNITPHIVLTYNSNNQRINGLLGVGFNIELGSISRATKFGVDYSANDYLVENYDGSKEIVQVKIPDSNTSEQKYKPIIEDDFTKYVYTNGQGWVATKRDGTKLFYGSLPSSRLSDTSGTKVFKWFLDKVEDTNGNYVSYSYSKVTSSTQPVYTQIYPLSISYNSNNDGSEAANQIKFYFEERTDSYNKYDTQFAVNTSQRLKTIVVESNNTTSNIYTFDYAYSFATLRSLLTKITLYGKSTKYDNINGTVIANSGKSRQPIKFEWNGLGIDSKLPFSYPIASNIVQGVPNYEKGECIKKLVDMDGNGSMDIVTTCTAVQGFPHKNNVIRWGAKDGLQAGTASTVFVGGITYLGGVGPLVDPNDLGYFVDLNGDGKTDKVEMDPDCRTNHYVYISDGLKFLPEQLWYATNVDCYFPPEFAHAVFSGFADFNGDGRADFLQVSAAGQHFVSLSTGSGYYQSEQQWGDFQGCQTGVLLDINGDGKSDFLGIHYDNINSTYKLMVSTGLKFESRSWSIPIDFFWLGFRTGDLNGDGRTDIVCFRPSNGKHQVLLSNGVDGFIKEVWETSAAQSAGNIKGPVDFFADGRSDFYSSPPPTAVDHSDTIYISTGKGFVVRTITKDLTGVATEYADINGDGNPDMFSNLQDLALSNFDMLSTSSPLPDYINLVTNEYGGGTELYYISSAVSGSNNMPIVNMNLDHATIYDDIQIKSSDSSVLYSYAGGLFDIPYREFLGYQFVTKQDSSGIVEITKYHQDYFRKGKKNGRRYYSPGDYLFDTKYQTFDSIINNDNLLKWELYNWDKTFAGEILPPSNVVYPEEFANSYFVKLGEIHKIFFDYELATANISERYTYYDSDNTPEDISDDNGLIRSKSISGMYGDDAELNYKYINKGGSNGWLWRLQEDSIFGTKTINDGVPTTGDVRKTTYTYESGTGNLKTKELWLEDKEAGLPNPTTEYILYDTYGNLKEEKDARQHVTEYTFDQVTRSFPSEIIRPSTNCITHKVVYPSYDYQCGKPTEAIDENNQSTSYVFDDFCRLKQIDYPDGGQEIKEYYDYPTYFPTYVITKTKEKATDDCAASGNCITKYEYFDGLNRLIQTVEFGEDRKPIIKLFYYDLAGRNNQICGPFFGASADYVTTTFSACAASNPWVEDIFDYLGRVTDHRTSDSNGNTISTTYVYYGFQKTTTDPDGSKKMEVRDYAGQLREVVEYVENGATQHTYYDYNAAGDLLSVVDALGNATSISYDTLGRKKSMLDPDMGAWSYTYDDNNNLKTQTDARGVVKTFAYDELNRLMSKSFFYPANYAGATTNPATYTYDTFDGFQVPNGIGRLTSSDNTDVLTKYGEYDPMGRITSVSKTITGAPSVYTTQYQYDLSGKTTGITFPDTFQLKNTYFPGSNLLQTVKGVLDPGFLATISNYSANGKFGRIGYGNGVVTDYQYDPLSSRLLSLTTGRYSVVTRPWPGSGDHTNTAEIQDKSYIYSNAGDIETITDHLKGATYTYYYDLLHRLTAEVAEGDDSVPAAIVAVPSYVGPGPVHAAKSITSEGVTYPFAYDANGNTLSGPDLTDPNNIVQRTIVYDAENMPVDINNGQVRLIYDADNSRAIKTGGTHVFYINDNYEEINGVGTKYIFAGNLRIAQITGQSRNYFHQDHLGSATVVTDGNSPALVESAEYLPFGMPRNAGSLITTTNYQYTDQEHDAEINLYNYDARLYDPAAGSFISADSIIPDYTNPQSLNRFSYVLNNPLVYTDPSGHEIRDDGSMSGFSDDVNATSNELWGATASSWEQGNYGAACFGGVLYGMNSISFGSASFLADMLFTDSWNTGVDISAGFQQGDWSRMGAGFFNIGLLATGERLLNPGVSAAKGVMHGPLNPGPLADDIANTFRSGSYTARNLSNPTTLYRVMGDSGNPTGSYWTSTKPLGPLQAVIDLALDQNWGNTATKVVQAEIPAGTRIYEGAAAAQRGLVGGTNQVYIPRVDPKWIIR